MKYLVALAIVPAASGTAAAADASTHGASAIISGVSCRTIDLTPNDGLAAYGRFISIQRPFGPFNVKGALVGDHGRKRVSKDRAGLRLDSLYLSVDSQGSSGTAALVANGKGTTGLLSASSVTAPGRVFDAYEFFTADFQEVKLGPFSAIECVGSYVITAWAKQTAGAPSSATSIATISARAMTDGPGAFVQVTASVNPANGGKYAQKSGKFTFRHTNNTSNEITTTGSIEAWVSGGQVKP